jgi:CRISPR/Cas system-associated endoribonuclease Cas2
MQKRQGAQLKHRIKRAVRVDKEKIITKSIRKTALGKTRKAEKANSNSGNTNRLSFGKL